MKKIVLVLMAVLCLSACEKEEDAAKTTATATATATVEAPASEEAPVVHEVIITSPEILKKKNFTLAGDKGITIGFDYFGEQFFGRVVNNYFGKYESSDGKIKLGTVGLTKMLASEEEMQKEQKYLENLKKIDSFEYKKNMLILKGKNVELVFEEIIE